MSTKDPIETTVAPYVEHVKYSLASAVERFTLAGNELDGETADAVLEARDALCVMVAELEYFYPSKGELAEEDLDQFLDALASNRRLLRKLAAGVAPTDWFLEHILCELAEEIRQLPPHLLVSLIDVPPEVEGWLDVKETGPGPRTPPVAAW